MSNQPNKCDESCLENRKWDLSKVCCCVRIIRLWTTDEKSRDSLLRSIATHHGQEHAFKVREALETSGKDRRKPA